MTILRSALPLLLLGCLAGAAANATPPPSSADRCAVSDELVTAAAPLQHVSAAILANRLDVLVVGSATVFGPEIVLQPGTVTAQSLGGTRTAVPPRQDIPGGPSMSAFPIRMAEALRAARPGLEVQVSVRGGRGMTAAEMLALLRQDLPGHRYQLVIWQTGTVEAVRNMPAGEFYQVLADGAALVSEAGADLVLVDQQYSRFLNANANLDPYAQSMQQIAAMPGAALFRRFEIMRAWANEGQIDLERTPKGERSAAVATLHGCLGKQLAHLLLNAPRS